MVTAINERKRFKPGTLGWRAADLDDPRIERLWAKGRYEIIDGRLIAMAPAYYDPNMRFMKLQAQLTIFQFQNKLGGAFGPECDIVAAGHRVLRADMIYMTSQQDRAQRAAAMRTGKKDVRRVRVLVPPTLIIESVSYGHEDHDRITKHAWYAEFGVPHYWIFDGLKRTLDCHTLARGRYKLTAHGENNDDVAVPLFKGLTVRLADIWRDD